MKLLLIDDEYENLGNTIKSIKHFFGKGNVEAVKSADEALGILENRAAEFDLALVDQKIDGDLLGVKLGEIINTRYPFISLIMFTGYASVSLCTDAMRVGFCDFLDKSNIINEESMKKSLLRISKLPAVLAKQKSKQELLNANLRIESLTNELNRLLIKISPTIKRSRGEKKVPTMRQMLDYQEAVLSLARTSKIEMDGDTLAIALLLLEQNKPLNEDTLDDIKREKVEVSLEKYGIKNKKPRATIQMRFQCFKDGIVTDACRQICILIDDDITNNKNCWPVTLQNAKARKRGQQEMHTFIDETVSYYRTINPDKL